MELKKEDFILVTALNGQKVLALRPDYFDAPIGSPILSAVAEAMEEKKEVEIEIPIPEPELTEEELAEIEKEKKKAELQAQLDALNE